MEGEDVGAVADAAAKAAALVQTARPLLHQSIRVRGRDPVDAHLMATLADAGLVRDLEAMARATEQAGTHLANMQGKPLNADAVQDLRAQVLSLSRAQERIDNSKLSGEALLFSRDSSALHTMSVLDEALKSVQEEDSLRSTYDEAMRGEAALRQAQEEALRSKDEALRSEEEAQGR
ncbi:hypothetical protein FOA52_010674 [Chlamydomonas sp. UWO 241]|nr:hypothetical protein FOA52_010674 [Chlamydomonas sp. UWO 241]